MDQADRDHIQHELEIVANELLPGWVRRVELPQHHQAPMIEPGQLMPRLVLAGRVVRRAEHPDPPKLRKEARTLEQQIAPGLNQFRDDLLRRRPEIRYFELTFVDGSGPDGGHYRPVRRRRPRGH